MIAAIRGRWSRPLAVVLAVGALSAASTTSSATVPATTAPTTGTTTPSTSAPGTTVPSSSPATTPGTATSGTVTSGTVTSGTATSGTAGSGTAPASTPGTATAGTTPVVALGERITWGSCARWVTPTTTFATTTECAALTVPLDYDHPDAGTIQIALSLTPATASRKGAVLFNPGGPGGSGFEPIARNGDGLAQALGLEHFDVIGFDPRGVDRSGAIACVDGAYLDATSYLDDTPDTPAEKAALDDEDKNFAAACTKKYGETLKYYSTANTARDMDSIRAALGDAQLSFLGISYGTYLGAVYATMFPDKVRGMVLDSAFEPNGDTPEQQVLTQLVGFEHAFDDWAAWCQQQASCAYHATDVGARWDALLAKLDATPMTVGTGAAAREVNQVVMETATTEALYSKSSWPALASALAKTEAGDATALLAMADDYNQRDKDGTYASIHQSGPVIRCASGFVDEAPSDPAALLAEMKRQAPRLARNTTLDDLRRETTSSCPLLTPGAAAIASVSYSGAGPIVVVGGTSDPATPIRWAQKMVGELGPNARLVTSNSPGHGQLLENTCVTKIEAALLADLTLPAAGTVCAADAEVAKPDWWDSLPVPTGIDAAVEASSFLDSLGAGPSQAYAEVRPTSLDADAALAAYSATLPADDFTLVGSPDSGIEGGTLNVYSTPDKHLLVILAISSSSPIWAELGDSVGDFPIGKTAVVVAALEQQASQ